MKRRTNRRATRAVAGALIAETPCLEPLETRLLFSTYTVTTLGDDAGTITPSGADQFNATTLRAAITAANANAGADTIEFAEGVSGTILIDSTLPAIADDLTVTGPGATELTVRHNDFGTVFYLEAGKSMEISALTVADGRAYLSDVSVGGAIYSDGTLVVIDCAFLNNRADIGGGAIYSSGTLNVSNCRFENNWASQDGGGIFSSGTLTVSGSTFSGNSADLSGGGINSTGTATVNNSVFLENSAENAGGGLCNNGGELISVANSFSRNSGDFGAAIYNAGSGRVTRNTFSGNSSGFEGGGIYNDFDSTLHVANSTFSGNSADFIGGGIYSDGRMTITNSTLSSNSASSGSGGISLNWGVLTLTNSIVVGNSSDAGESEDVSQSINSALTPDSADNLVGSTNINFVTGINGSKVGVTLAQVKLGELADNGGPTQTIALLPGSIAIDAGSNAYAVDANGDPLGTDQRGDGFARIVGGTVDVGAFEVQSGEAVGNGSVSGVVFKDADSNGVQDDGEKGAKSWLVWADLNKDGRLNHGEPRTITNSKGHYQLADLPAGPLVLRVEKRRDAKQTLPPANKAQVPIIVAGQDVADVNFGIQPLAGPQYAPGTGAVSGAVFDDANGNESQDDGEAGLGVWLVWADLNHDGRLNFNEPRTITNAQGKYVLYDVPAGPQVLRVEKRAGWQQTSPTGGNANIAEVLEGKLIGDWDFGVRPIAG